MKKYLLLAVLVYSHLFALSQNINIVPWPVSLAQKQGVFILQNNTEIIADSYSNSVASFLSSALHTSTGYTIPVTGKNSRPNFIQLVILTATDKTIGEEGYKLSVTPQSVIITANNSAGLFYGAQTLLQLLPKEIESKKEIKNVSWTIPAIEITDYPRFAWRGLMLDVVRHFFTVGEVKGFIDNMVKYKYNVLHLHLSDDQGWRIEIKSLPELTKVGAWRGARIGKWGSFSPQTVDEPKNYGGYYTQEEMKEIIAYAKERFVNILPEIDGPGHSLAAIASYPDLSCTPGTYLVNGGDKLMNWYPGGFSAIIDNTLCPANEKVYTFLDKVFTELAALFPFEYIHMGGDECAKNFWGNNPAIKALMKREKLKSLAEVQSYYTKRVEKIISSKGKKTIGWDEILDGGIADEAAVMSWRGMKGGIAAAALGHKVVMSPQEFAYFDLYQGDPFAEPAIAYAGVRLSHAYTFDPVPPDVDASMILGGQANLWSEQLATMRHAQYMLWPRALALAECVWTPVSQKNWERFEGIVEKQMERFDVAEIKYSRSMFDPIFTAQKDNKGNAVVTLSTEVTGLNIYYSFDETPPDNFYPEYKAPLTIPPEAQNLKVITYRNGVQAGKPVNIPVAELKRRAGVK